MNTSHDSYTEDLYCIVVMKKKTRIIEERKKF